MGRPRLSTFASRFFSAPEWGEAQYWVLGWFYADGYNSNSAASISVHTKDGEVLEKVARVMRCASPRKPNGRNVKVLMISSRTLCDRLTELGCIRRKSLVVQYPTFLSTRDQHRHFLRGVFEGDGSVYKMGQRLSTRTEIASGSLDFLVALQRVIREQTGLDSKVGYTRGLPRKLLIGHGYQDALTFLTYIYDGANPELVMERKHTKWLELRERVANPPPKRTWNTNSTRRRAFYLRSPAGVIHHSDMVKPFALEHGMGVSNLARVARGDRHFNSIKGWVVPTLDEVDAARRAGRLVVKTYARSTV